MLEHIDRNQEFDELAKVIFPVRSENLIRTALFCYKLHRRAVFCEIEPVTGSDHIRRAFEILITQCEAASFFVH